jgi:RsiW-degrading membrane proteinase PrsW (M82 family)
MLLLALALGPVAFFFTYVYLRDKYEREPLKYLIISFLLGVLIAFPVIFFGEQLQAYTGTSGDANWIDLLIYAFVVVALTEEGFKYLALRLYMYRHEEFDEPYDGIMYGAAVSLGFAAIENILYVFMASEAAVETGLLRMFTAVPAHAVFGVMMGYFLGHAKFATDKKKATLDHLKGLGSAILLHGIYDYFLFLGVEYLVPFTFLTLILGIFVARRAIREHAANSPHRHGLPTPEIGQIPDEDDYL